MTNAAWVPSPSQPNQPQHRSANSRSYTVRVNIQTASHARTPMPAIQVQTGNHFHIVSSPTVTPHPINPAPATAAGPARRNAVLP